jgi:hypothetical protein
MSVAAFIHQGTTDVDGRSWCDRTVSSSLFAVLSRQSVHYFHQEQYYGVRFPDAAMIQFGASFRLGGSRCYSNLPMMVSV